MKNYNSLTTMLLSTMLIITGCNKGQNSNISNSSSNDYNSVISSEELSNDSSNSSLENSESSDKEEVKLKDKTINVYLIGGQSNAVGYGMDTYNSISNSDPRFVNGFDNVLYYGEQERWDNANFIDDFVPVKVGLGVANNRSGAEIGIASAIADEGEMNAIIKCAWGATHLYPDSTYDISFAQGTWTSPSYIENKNVDVSANHMIGRMYSWFEETVTKGIQLLVEDGYIPVINRRGFRQ